jgi:hypothetical protein
LDERGFEVQLSKKAKFDSQIKNLLINREQLNEQLKILREQNIFENFSKVSNKQEELI